MSIRELRLFAHATRVAWRARRVTASPVTEVAEELTAMRGLPAEVSPAEASLAAARACRRLARWAGSIDTCLTRSLVTAALLADQDEVLLHLGFRPGETRGRADGHAWVTFGGEAVSERDPAARPEAPFIPVLTVQLRRERA